MPLTFDLPLDKLRKLREVSRFILELANVPPNRYQPYVGRSAFSHKGGVHISAVERAGGSNLREGQKIEYELTQDSRSGKSAAENLKFLD